MLFCCLSILRISSLYVLLDRNLCHVYELFSLLHLKLFSLHPLLLALLFFFPSFELFTGTIFISLSLSPTVFATLLSIVNCYQTLILSTTLQNHQFLQLCWKNCILSVNKLKHSFYSLILNYKIIHWFL